MGSILFLELDIVTYVWNISEGIEMLFLDKTWMGLRFPSSRRLFLEMKGPPLPLQERLSYKYQQIKKGYVFHKKGISY